MNTRNRTRLLASFALLAASSAWQGLLAQSAPTASAARAAADEEKPVIELSPFEVSAERDDGYVATETLAGTRIRTDLRDIGSSISVATKEFMRDIGAYDNQTLLQYMASAEVGGNLGNFSGLGDNSVPNESGNLVRPNSNTRIRGLAQATNSRDFFETSIPWDGYNVSRVELLRGANSLLFGNGSGAGIINNATDTALFGLNRTTVELLTDSEGSYRGSLNLNRELLRDQLAIRLAALAHKRYYQQDPAYNDDRRYYGAVRFEPELLKRGSARTTFRASFETGDIEGNRPRSNTPMDSISPWFMTANREMRSPDGTLLGVMRPMKSHAGYDPFVTNLNDAAIIAANPGRGDIGARAPHGPAVAATSEPWLGRGTGPGIAGWQNGGIAAFFPDPGSGTLAFYIPQAPGATMFNAIGPTGVRDGSVNGLRGVDNAAIVRLDQYSILGVGGRLTENDGWLYERQGVYKAVGLTDASFFDFYNKLLDGPNKRETQRFKAVNLQVDQTFFNDKAGVQLAYDNQRYREFQLNYLNTDTTLSIDVYRYLPIATYDSATATFVPVLNPNFGRPFVAITPSGSRSWQERETLRATPFVDLDSKLLLERDNWLTKILGRHTITGLAERNEFISRGLDFSRWAVEDTQSANLFGPNVGIGTRRLAALTYLGPSLATGTMTGADISNVAGRQNVATGPGYWFDATYTGAIANAATTYTRAAGLLPNQTGNTNTATLTQSENPANYAGWGSGSTPTLRTLNVISAESGAETSLTTRDNERRDRTTSFAIVDQWKLLDGHVVVTGGLRRDEIETFWPGDPAVAPAMRNGDRARFATTQVDYSAPYQYTDEPGFTFESDWLKTWSIVAHSPDFINRRLPWGLKLSGFYNRSENLRPVSRVGIFGDPLTPPVGKTKDYGVIVSALEGRVSLKVNRYRTEVANDSLGDNFIRTTTGDEVSRGIQFALAIQNHGTAFNYRHVATPGAGANANVPYLVGGQEFISAYQPSRQATAANPWTLEEWQAAEAQAQAQAKAFLDATLPQTAFLNTWGINPGAWSSTAFNFGVGHSIPAGLSITGDTVSEGTEFELFLRPTRNWDVAINASKTSARRISIAGNFSEWVESRWELLQGPAGDIRWFGGWGNFYSDADYAAQNRKPGDPTADYGRIRVGRNLWKWYNEFRAREGSDVPELRPWRFNMTARYTFDGDGFGGPRLKGVFVGASYRWEDNNVIGWQVKQIEPQIGNNPPVGAYDIDKPFHGPEEKHLDLFAGFSRRIFRDITWRMQVNVQNAFEEDRLIPINANPDGSAAGMRIAYGTSWSLSSRFEF
ncbi:MAG TPA: TonB-dependent receptor plug domain-containing protein [Opitutaceae bacterium]|nr:TonB-dependent receptor plug domain-containing protein [Opitutaceae bacterium]